MRALRISRKLYSQQTKITLSLIFKNRSLVDPCVCHHLKVSFLSYSAPMESKEHSKSQKVDLSVNPFFEKYKAKLQHMRDENPEEYEEKLKELSERLNPSKTVSKNEGSSVDPDVKPSAPKPVPPSDEARSGVGMTKTKSLDSVMKMELIQDKSAEEISQIWKEHHAKKDCVYAVLTKSEYKNVMDKAKECPVFVYPIPRDDGYEFILKQFDRKDVYFTPLAMFQVVRENAPPCLTLNHYTELMDDKGIVLMSGQYDEKVLKQTLALNLVQQMSTFYGKGSKYYDLVKRFNYEPEQFQYNDLIDAFKSLPQHDLK